MEREKGLPVRAVAKAAGGGGKKVGFGAKPRRKNMRREKSTCSPPKECSKKPLIGGVAHERKRLTNDKDKLVEGAVKPKVGSPKFNAKKDWQKRVRFRDKKESRFVEKVGVATTMGKSGAPETRMRHASSRRSRPERGQTENGRLTAGCRGDGDGGRKRRGVRR